MRKKPRFLVKCACGCDQQLETPNKYGVDTKWIRGHNSRFIPRTSKSSPDKSYSCTRCKKDLPYSAFVPHQYQKADGKIYEKIHGRCRNCTNEVARLAPEEIKQIHRKAHSLHHKKMKEKGDIAYWCRTRLRSFRNRTHSSDLTADYLVQLYEEQKGLCYYTGEPMIMPIGKSHQDGMSLDRMDPDKGYTRGNVAWCKYKINTMKSNRTKDEFVALCRAIAQRFET